MIASHSSPSSLSSFRVRLILVHHLLLFSLPYSSDVWPKLCLRRGNVAVCVVGRPLPGRRPAGQRSRMRHHGNRHLGRIPSHIARLWSDANDCGRRAQIGPRPGALFGRAARGSLSTQDFRSVSLYSPFFFRFRFALVGPSWLPVACSSRLVLMESVEGFFWVFFSIFQFFNFSMCHFQFYWVLVCLVELIKLLAFC